MRIFLGVSLLASSSVIWANNSMSIDGYMDISVPFSQNITKQKESLAAPESRTFRFMKVSLDAEAQEKFAKKVADYNASKLVANSSYEENPTFADEDLNVALEMNNVPVLDQGQYGTCVTFANTAALDAHFDLGDFASQQCSLELGVSLYGPNGSGWSGSWGEYVLNELNEFGVVSHADCPQTYPSPYGNSGYYSLSKNEYTNLSNGNQYSNFTWTSLSSGSVEQTKAALDRGHRVTIGTLLLPSSTAGYPVNDQTTGFWSFSKDDNPLRCKYSSCPGHEVVVTGYDDKNQVFKIRNSWSEGAGVNGNFYMSYDFYKVMVIEAQEIA